jgi:hypothetical protein
MSAQLLHHVPGLDCGERERDDKQYCEKTAMSQLGGHFALLHGRSEPATIMHSPAKRRNSGP